LVGVVAGANGSVSRKPSLKALSDVVAGDLTAVNALIVERMQSPVALIPQLASHVIAAGGKRLRPMLTLATSRLAGYDGSRHLRLAACVEFIHTATLLHDDVVDASDLRRGHASANTLWGNKSSVLVGDFLFSRAFELMVEDGSPAVLAILSRASSIIAEGEVAQLVTTGDVETTEEAYMAVIRAKTAQLFAAACRIGAVVADRPADDEAALEAFGMNLGIAFQLVDDVLDYSAVQATLGKTIGDDFREGKMTLPVVLALARASDEERTFWQRTIGDMEQTPADLDRAIGIVRARGALDDTLARARDFARAATAALDRFDDGPEKRALVDVVEFCIGRTY
jgi:octaprenyl-diphosphate synthase